VNYFPLSASLIPPTRVANFARSFAALLDPSSSWQSLDLSSSSEKSLKAMYETHQAGETLASPFIDA